MKNLAYFDGKKTHTGKLCAHCKFFYATKKPFVADKQGHCMRKDKCYPAHCFCCTPLTEPISGCKYWLERSDAEKITQESELSSSHDLVVDHDSGRWLE